MTFNCSLLNQKYLIAMEELSKEFSFEISNSGIQIVVNKNENNSLEIDFKNRIANISIAKDVMLYTAIRLLLAQGDVESFKYHGSPKIEELTYMLDCSRNAVSHVSTVKKLIRHLAFMGYDSIQLYTEDTFLVKEEAYFGYLRNPFSKEDIQEIDKYCMIFGIELIPCIQTLAHLNGIARWSEYFDNFDCHDILLVGHERTYQLLEHMFETVSECFTSRRINIGMDEAAFLGRGKFILKNGYQDRYSIMLSHLKRVNELVHRFGFTAMMWSDMFFSLTSNDYYQENNQIPQHILDEIPADINLIYWDYYHLDYDSYNSMLKKHSAFNNNIYFAGGAWKWIGFAPDNRYSIEASKQAFQACFDNHVKNIIITGWGDNGAECSTFSILPSLLYNACCKYGDLEVDDEYKKSFYAMTKIEVADFMSLDLPNRLSIDGPISEKNSANKYLLYNDPMLGIMDSTVDKGYNELYRSHATKLKEVARSAGKWGYLFQNLASLCDVLSIKAELGVLLRESYVNKDLKKLNSLNQDIKKLLYLLDIFHQNMYYQWNLENRANGFDVLDLRMGALKQRLMTTSFKLEKYLEGSLDKISELEEKILDFNGSFWDHKKDKDQCEYRWLTVSSVNVNN